MTITRALRYLMVSALLAVGGFALIVPAQAAEVAPENVPVEESTEATLTITEGTTEESGEESSTEAAVTISEEVVDEEFFPEIDVVTSADTTEAVAYGGVKFVAGDTLSIQQEKAVDIFAAAGSIYLEEALTGDLFAAADILNINAPVAGSVRLAGNTVTINSTIDRNVLVFANTVYIGSDAVISGHANIYAASVIIDGTVEQNLEVYAETVTVNGAVMGSSSMEVSSAFIGADALIDTAGTIRSPYEPEVHADAVGGDLLTYEYTDHSEYKEGYTDKRDRLLARSQKWTVSFFFFLIVGGLMIILWPKWTQRVSKTMEKEFGQSAQKGLVYLFFVPLVLFAAAVTILLLPFSFFAVPLYALSLIVARVFVGMLLGRHLVNKKFKEAKKQRLLEYMVGYFIVSVLLSLPLVGWFFCTLAGAWGMGGVLQDWSNHRHKKKKKRK